MVICELAEGLPQQEGGQKSQQWTENRQCCLASCQLLKYLQQDVYKSKSKMVNALRIPRSQVFRLCPGGVSLTLLVHR